MERVTKIILGGSALALVGLLGLPRRGAGGLASPTSDLVQQSPPVAQAQAPARQVARFEGASDELLAKQRERAAELRYVRDPFAAPAPPAEPEPEPEPVLEITTPEPPTPPTLRLTGIGRFGSDVRALIDGELLSVGADLPRGGTLLRIERDSITVLHEGVEWNVPLRDEP